MSNLPLSTMAIDALIINPDLESRTRLKEMTRGLGVFGQVHLSAGLDEGLLRLDRELHYDALYLSSWFDPIVLSEFVHSAKKATSTADAAYLLTVRGSENRPESLARAIVSGIDGFLMEPFSADSLIESTKLATRISKQRSSARHRIGVSLIVDQMLATVDEIWMHRRMQVPAGLATKRLHSLQEIVLALEPDLLEMYYALMLEKTDQIACAALPETRYRGVSSRVNARLIKKR